MVPGDFGSASDSSRCSELTYTTYDFGSITLIFSVGSGYAWLWESGETVVRIERCWDLGEALEYCAGDLMASPIEDYVILVQTFGYMISIMNIDKQEAFFQGNV